jgi:acyl-CoA thioester hydrolase
VIRAELDYKKSLQGGDRFLVGTRVERVSPIRFAFHQDIFRPPDDSLILRARIVGTVLNEKGRPKMPEAIAAVLTRSSGKKTAS